MSRLLIYSILTLSLLLWVNVATTEEIVESRSDLSETRVKRSDLAVEEDDQNQIEEHIRVKRDGQTNGLLIMPAPAGRRAGSGGKSRKDAEERKAKHERRHKMAEKKMREKKKHGGKKKKTDKSEESDEDDSEETTLAPDGSKTTTAASKNSSATTAAPKNSSVTTSAPKNSSVTTAAPNNSSATTAAPKNSSVTTAAPANSSVTTTASKNSSVTTAAPANSSATTAAPKNSSVTTAAPANSSATTGAPANSSVTTAAPANSSVTTAAPANSSVTTAAPTNSSAATTAAPTNSSATTAAPDNSSATTAAPASKYTDGPFEKEALEKINELRAKHHAPPLTIILHDNITEGAHKWAQKMAADGKISHSCPEYTCGYGENVAKIRPMNMLEGVLRAIQEWYDEVETYDYATGKSKNESVVGHFTAIAWFNTTNVGFGAIRGEKDFLYIVAQFAPPGNMQGDYQANVLPP